MIIDCHPEVDDDGAAQRFAASFFFFLFLEILTAVQAYPRLFMSLETMLLEHFSAREKRKNGYSGPASAPAPAPTPQKLAYLCGRVCTKHFILYQETSRLTRMGSLPLL